LYAGGRRRTGFGLAQARQRQRAERCKAAGDETRSAQKASAVKTALRLVRQSDSKRTAAGVPFHSLDQHACLLIWPDSG
jgi:hypothetical protein